MRGKLLLVDTKCPSGHVPLYRGQIRDFQKEHRITFATTPGFFEHFSDLGITHMPIPASPYQHRGKVGYRLQQIRRMLGPLRQWRRAGYEKCVVLSHDTAALAVVSRLVDVTGVAFFMHNNIDEALRSPVRRRLLRASVRAGSFCVFEKYIGDFLRAEYGADTVVVDHYQRPIAPTARPDLAPAGGRPFVFCPTTGSDGGFVKKLVGFCAENDLLLVSKPHPELPDTPMVRVSRHFDNYDDLLLAAAFVAIGSDYQYRVSGVFYEALANEKKMIAKHSLFMRKVADKSRLPVVLF